MVAECLKSILMQTHANYECLLLDDSTDANTSSVCERFSRLDNRFKYIKSEIRLGLTKSLNFGISVGKGEYFARLDPDDVCEPNRLKLQVEFLNLNPNVGVLGGAVEVIDENGNTLNFFRYPLSHNGIRLQFSLLNAICHPAVMVRRIIFTKFGCYDPNFILCEDLELWLRFLKHQVIFRNLDVILIKYRRGNLVRSRENWNFNLRARLKNFQFTQMPLSVIGMVCAFAFSYLPISVTKFIYRWFIFSKT